MSVSGFFENLGENVKENVMGVTDALAITGKSLAYIVNNAKWLGDVDAAYFGEDMKQVGKALVKAITEKYEKHGLKAGYYKPVDVVGDVLTILSAGGGTVGKAGQILKMPKLEAAGKAVAAVPGKLGELVAEAPIRLAGKNPKLRKMLTKYEGEEQAIGKITESNLQKVLDEKFKGFTDQDKALLDKLAVEGGTAVELAANPRVKDALEAYGGIVREIREKQLGEAGRRLLTAEDMRAAIVKKLANRKGIGLDEAAKLYDEMEVKPIYTPAIAEGKQVGIFDLIWGPDEVRTGKVGFLEKFGGGKFSQDPIQYMKKAVKDFVDVETRLRFMDRVIQDKNLTTAVTKGGSAITPVIPDGIFKKYWDDRGRAQAIATRDLQAKHGIAEAERLMTSDPVTQKYVRAIASVGATDPTVASYLKWTFTKASGKLGAFVRVYDKLINAFKVSATTLNPRYYTGNIVGDGILSVMAGEVGLNWKMAKRIMDSLPPELRVGGVRTALAENPILSKFQNLSQISQAADDMARAGIWTREVAKKFKEAGSSFTSAEQTFEEFARAVGASVEDLSTLQMKSQLIGEKIALSSQELLKANRTVERLENAVLKSENNWYRKHVEGKNLDHAQTASVIASNKKANALRDQLWEARQVQDRLKDKIHQQFVESGEYHRRIPEATRLVEVSRQATDRANTFLGDYLALGPIERGLFRRVVPFYAFTKAMTKLAFTYPFIAPKTAFFWHRYAQAMADMMGDPEMPEWNAGYFPVGGFEDGDTLWIRLSQMGPFGGVRTGRAGDLPIPSILQFWQQNPIIKLGYRMVGGRDEYYWAGKPSAGEVMVSAGDGRIHRFRPDGRLETVVPQMSPLDAVSTMFPVTQVINQLIQNYDVMKGNEQKPDGSYKYPMGWGEKIGKTLGLSTKTGDAADFKRFEKIRAIRIFKDLERMYPRMDQVQREQTKELFRDFASGDFRRFKAAQ